MIYPRTVTSVLTGCLTPRDKRNSKRMIIRVVQGKGGKDRDLPLTPELLETLRAYWRWRKTKGISVPQSRRAQRAGRAALR
jgi:integrase